MRLNVFYKIILCENVSSFSLTKTSREKLFILLFLGLVAALFRFTRRSCGASVNENVRPCPH